MGQTASLKRLESVVVGIINGRTGEGHPATPVAMRATKASRARESRRRERLPLATKRRGAGARVGLAPRAHASPNKELSVRALQTVFSARHKARGARPRAAFLNRRTRGAQPRLPRGGRWLVAGPGEERDEPSSARRACSPVASRCSRSPSARAARPAPRSRTRLCARPSQTTSRHRGRTTRRSGAPSRPGTRPRSPT